MLRPNLQRRKPHNRHCYHRRNRHTNHHRNQEHQLGSDQVPAALAKAACDSGGPKGGTPLCARLGAIIDGLGLGVSSGIGLTLVRGVPEATGIRTAALAKKYKVNLEEANTDGELLPTTMHLENAGLRLRGYKQ